MQPPKITFDARRLAVLDSYDILDTPAEPGFDDIVHLAAHICEAPVALVSLVAGDRQWFKARIGFESSETDLSRSVCAHALAEPDLLIIPDLTKDPRSRSNPLVTGPPHARFYAGAPLVAPSGEVLGSLCVLDGTPRPGGLSDKQAEMLRRLASQVLTQLELRRAVAERDAVMAAKAVVERKETESTALYRVLFDAIDAGFCIVEMKFDDGGKAIDYRFVEVNPAFERKTGLADARGRWMRDLVPSHEQHWFDLYGQVALTGERVHFENPAKDLGDRWYEVQAFPVGLADVRHVGILFQDISDRRRAEAARVKAEADQVFLNHELSHRMKNTFAMVQAIAMQTLRKVADREPVEAFTARIHALSRAHDVLLQRNWVAAPMDKVVKAAIGTLEMPERFDLSGPEVDLGARTALSLSLVLHELTTNAMKYGALASPAGHVALNWRIAGEGKQAELLLDWLETGGPPVMDVKLKGFGSRLIRLGITGTGGADLDYRRSGLHAVFRAPLDQVQLS